MKFLTANNQRVQNYIMHSNHKPSTKKTKDRMALLSVTLESNGRFFSEVFPAAQARVVDEIIFLTSGCGIAKIGSDRLADRSDVSVRTVTSAVRTLKDMNQFIVARIASGRAGKYIFVDKCHTNFEQIMKDVFSINAELFAELKNSQNTDTIGSNGKKLSPNHYIYLKHALTNYISYQLIQNEIDKDKPKTIAEQRDYINTYGTNPFQELFFEFIVSMPYADVFIQHASVIALRLGSDADSKRFAIAKDVINNMAIQHSEGARFDKLVASFSAGYKQAIVRSDKKALIIREVKSSNRIVPTFYNWLEEK